MVNYSLDFEFILTSHYAPQLCGSFRKYEETLFAHTDRVNVVKWIQGTGIFQNSFISASVDKTAIVWIHKKHSYNPEYVLKSKFRILWSEYQRIRQSYINSRLFLIFVEHNNSITDVTSMQLQLETGSCLLIATMSMDEVVTWKKDDDEGTSYSSPSEKLLQIYVNKVKWNQTNLWPKNCVRREIFWNVWAQSRFVQATNY